MKHLSFFISFALLAQTLHGQVELDRSIQFTGAGNNAKVEGIKSVTSAQDAVSAEVLQRNGLIYSPASAAGNDYSVTTSPSFGGPLVAGQIIHFRASSANTGAATLNVNGTGAVPIRKNFDVALQANDLKAGQFVSVIYDATNAWWQMLSQTGNSVTCAAPGQPVAGAHTATSNSITWIWSMNTNDVVFFKYNTTNNFNTATSVGANFSFTQTGLSVYTTYQLYVWAFNHCGVSTPVVMSKKTNCYAAGESALGGRVAYIQSGTCTGLVVQSADGNGGSSMYWSSCCGPCQNTFVSTSVNYGFGQSNTNNILSTYNPMNCTSPNQAGEAARYCDNLNEGSYTDWYLPSKGDVDTMLPNLTSVGMVNGNYWSSSQGGYCGGCPGYYAWLLSVSGGTGTWNSSALTGQSQKVRCSRNFNIP
jgi:hypothetical protein